MNGQPQKLVFIKLGGSIITDKNRNQTVRKKLLMQICREIEQAHRELPSLRLIIGHGSGSFGHMAAKKYGTRSGIHSKAGWEGFIEVWRAARKLNQVVVHSLSEAGLPVLAFPPSAAVIAENMQINSWDLKPLQTALQNGIIPVIAGDVIFDKVLGGTILSTEELFQHLALKFLPDRILIAGIEEGVWADYPACTTLIPVLNSQNYSVYQKSLTGSGSVDVTGGMVQKVETMLDLVKTIPGLEISIFSGIKPGEVLHCLTGGYPGTIIH